MRGGEGDFGGYPLLRGEGCAGENDPVRRSGGCAGGTTSGVRLCGPQQQAGDGSETKQTPEPDLKLKPCATAPLRWKELSADSIRAKPAALAASILNFPPGLHLATHTLCLWIKYDEDLDSELRDLDPNHGTDRPRTVRRQLLQKKECEDVSLACSMLKGRIFLKDDGPRRVDGLRIKLWHSSRMVQDLSPGILVALASIGSLAKDGLRIGHNLIMAKWRISQKTILLLADSLPDLTHLELHSCMLARDAWAGMAVDLPHLRDLRARSSIQLHEVVGFSIVLDKPMCLTLWTSSSIKAKVRDSWRSGVKTR